MAELQHRRQGIRPADIRNYQAKRDAERRHQLQHRPSGQNTLRKRKRDLLPLARRRIDPPNAEAEAVLLPLLLLSFVKPAIHASRLVEIGALLSVGANMLALQLTLCHLLRHFEDLILKLAMVTQSVLA